jgi:secreted Zn-dependent insulinase-like peptidase
VTICSSTEGAGSLLSLLKAKGLATDLTAGVGDGGYDRSSAGYMFTVNINLTDSGLEHVCTCILLMEKVSTSYDLLS